MRKALFFSILAFLSLHTSTINGQWVSTGFKKVTWALCQAENGNLIAASYKNPNEDGIYVSVDNGETWEKATATNDSYTAWAVNGKSIFMGGLWCNVAISHDNGESWTNVNFLDLFTDITEYNPIYAMEYHNGRIYASVLSKGIVYSEDDGQTWHMTDINSLLDANEPENGGQWCYNLRSHKGILYNIGTYGIWTYDEESDLWTNIDDRWYGQSSCIVDDVFYVNYNAYGVPDGVRYTTDFKTWQSLPLPNDMSTQIRSIAYYNGAIFIGHVFDAVYYTLDHGETWQPYRENFPSSSPVPGIVFHSVPMDFVFKNDEIFCGAWSPTEELGGVYKIAMPEEITNMETIQTPSLPLLVYPNPADDTIFFKLSEVEKNNAIITITDIAGKIKYKNETPNQDSNTITVNTKNWGSGIYLYTITTENSKTSGKFMVK